MITRRTLLKAMTLAPMALAISRVIPDTPLLPGFLKPMDAFAATTYHFAAAGNNANDGSLGSPKQNIAGANAITLVPGDVLAFNGGETFTGGPLIISQSGSNGSPITITSYGSGRAVLSSTGYGLKIENKEYVEVTTINFTGGNHDTNVGRGIWVKNDGTSTLHHIYLTDLDVQLFGARGVDIRTQNDSTNCKWDDISLLRVVSHDNLYDGMTVKGLTAAGDAQFDVITNLYIGYCTAYNNVGDNGSLGLMSVPSNTGNGILAVGVLGGTVEYCLAHDNGAAATSNGGGGGIWCDASKNLTFQFCESYNHKNTLDSNDGLGYDIDSNSQNVTIQYCYSHGNDGVGFAMGTYDNVGNNRTYTGNTIRFCISENDGRKQLTGTAASGFLMFVSSGQPLANCEVYHNTVYTLKPTTTAACVYIWANATNGGVNFRNNIFQTTSTNPLLIVGSGQTGLVFDNNDYWPSGGTFKITWSGTDYASVAAFHAGVSSQETNGLQVDPKLVNAGNGGTIGDATLLATNLTAYRLTANSPVISKGLDLKHGLSIATGSQDFYGRGYPKWYPDLGAAMFPARAVERRRLN